MYQVLLVFLWDWLAPVRAWFLSPMNIIQSSSIALMIGLCVVLAVPIPTFPTSQSYALMAKIGPEWAWAIFFGTVAIINIQAMISNLFWEKIVADFIMCFTCVAVSLLFFFANHVSTGIIPYGIFAIQTAWKLNQQARTRNV